MTDQVNFMDGFDLYSSSSDLAGLGVYSGSGAGWGSTDGRFGGGAAHLSSYNQTLVRALLSSPTAIVVGFAYKTYGTPSGSNVVLTFLSSNGTECALWLNTATNQFYLTEGYSTTIWTGTALAGLSGWHYIEIFLQLGPSSGGTTGEINMQLDGAAYGTPNTALNTNGAGGSYFSSIQFGGDNNAMTFYIDDLVIRDESGNAGGYTFFGDVKIQTLSPTSDGPTNNGTPASGSAHYAMVDSVPYNTDDYITMTNTSGQKELYGCASVSGTPASIYSIDVVLIAEKTDAGSAFLETIISSSGTSANGNSLAMTTGYGMFRENYDTDPHTSSAWTASGVNALKIGYQVP